MRLIAGHMEKLEAQIAHLIRTVDDLSEVIARQDKEIALLTRRVQMLMEREAQREAENTGGIVLGDERPPHY
jgi:SlyX protein